MKKEFLLLLACPNCGFDLELKEAIADGAEISDGTLNCLGCRREFSVTGGIPRFLCGFIESETTQRFGYEWKSFPQVTEQYEKQFLDWICPIGKDFFEGKIVLDAGCGKGRHIRLAAGFGAKLVIGMDLSEAIEVAYNNTKDLGNVFLIQADVYHPPLKPELDYIYCVGVLHHLANPAQGFKALHSILKGGGTLSTWVYAQEGNEWLIRLVNPLRKSLTSKMPLPLLKGLSLPLAVLLYVVSKVFYRPLNLYWGSRVRLLFYNDYLFYLSGFNFQEIHSIVFDHLLAPVAFYLKREEVLSWYENAPFTGVTISWHNRNSWRATARKDTHA
jgi:SAM-dependent methyltransferase